jgi:hypothetical protein
MKILERRLWRQASLSIGAPLVNLEGGSFTRDLETWMKGALEMGRLSLRELCERNLVGRTALVGSLEDI